MDDREQAFDRVELPDEAIDPCFDPAMARALEEASKWIGEGVQGVGEGRAKNGDPCIVVFASGGGIRPEDRFPDTIRGFAVVVSETDDFQALPG